MRFSSFKRQGGAGMGCFTFLRFNVFLAALLLFARPGYSQTVVRVDITAATTILTAGQTVPATAAAKDADGAVIPGAPFTWVSRAPAVAAVDSSGIVTGVFPGTAQITARTGNITGILTFIVVPSRVELDAPPAMLLNTSLTLGARALDIRNGVIPNAVFTWTTDNPGVATVTTSGVVQAVGLGVATITATQSGFSDSRAIRVQRPLDFTLDPVVTTDFAEGYASQIQIITAVSNMNAQGDVAFVANLSGKTSAVLRDVQGQVSAVARTGDPAPLGGVFTSFGTPAINARGDVAFVATVANGLGPLLLLFRDGELQVLLVGGDFLEAGGTVGAITLSQDSLDDAGFVTVHLTVANPNHSGVFRISPETGVEALIRTFDQVSIGTPTALTPFSVSPGGRVAVLVTAGARRGIYVVSTAAINPVVVDGAAAPGGTPFTTFSGVRSASNSELFFTATAQGGMQSLFRSTTSGITEVVRGGRESATRTITVTTLLSGVSGAALFSGTVSDLGIGIFSWSGAGLGSVAVRNAVVAGGEALTRPDGAWINASGQIHLFTVTDRYLNATYRITAEGVALRWASGSIVPIAANYNVVFTSSLRPGPDVSYFLAGSPLGLFQKSGNVVTPVAIPGMRSSRGAYTGVVIASSNAAGDAVFVANSIDLTRLTAATVLYRYSKGIVTELVAFGSQIPIGGTSRTVTATGLNSIGFNNAGEIAFSASVDNRQSLVALGAELRILLQATAASPNGGTFTGFNNIQVTPSGAVAFTGVVNGGPTGGIYLHRSGQIVSVATIADYRGLGAPAVGGETVYFTGARDTASGLWAYANGNVSAVVSVGAVLPTNGVLTNVLLYSAQEDGTVVFYAASVFGGVFARRADGRMSTVALISETTPLAGRFTAFGVLSVANSVVVLNSQLTPDRTGIFLAWPAGSQPANTVSSANFTMVNRAAVSIRTAGENGPLTNGYAVVQAAAGSTVPSGLSIFSLRQDNVLVSEATVPMTGLLQEGRIYAEVNGPTNTGIAIANPGGGTATISYYFTDAAGQDFGWNQTEITPGGQMSRFLNQSPFNSRPVFNGTFTFASSQPVSVIALRSYVNERSDFLMTTLPVSSPGQVSAGPLVFPHFADGQGWTSQVVLVNPTGSTLTGTMEFFGRRTRITQGYSISPNSSFVYESPGVPVPTDSGWVQVTPSEGSVSPSGLLIFFYRRNGVLVTTASVPSSTAGTAFRLYLDSAGNINTAQVGSMQTGVAIANTSNAAVTVNFEATNFSGASLGMTGTATIPARGQLAAFANQIRGLEGLLAAQGVLRMSATGPVSVIGLRGRYNERGDFLITTLEPTNETAPAFTGERYMPHFADSGGYTTQFILYNGTVNQPSAGTLRFFSQSGQPLGLTLR